MCVPWALGPWWKVPVQRLWSLKEFTASPKFSSVITHQLETGAANKQSSHFEAGQEQTALKLVKSKLLWSWSRANWRSVDGAPRKQRSKSGNSDAPRVPTEECCAARDLFLSKVLKMVACTHCKCSIILVYIYQIKSRERQGQQMSNKTSQLDL